MQTSRLPRLAFRQSRWVLQRRAQSSTTESATQTVSEQANKAKEGASQAASRAQQGLSRVTSSAGNVLNSASNAAGNAVSRIGGRTGSLINRVQGSFMFDHEALTAVNEDLKSSNTTNNLLCPRRRRIGHNNLPRPKYAASVNQIHFQLRSPTTNFSRTMQTVQSYLTPLTNAVRNPSSLMSQGARAAESTTQSAVSNPQSFLERVRNMDSATLLAAGIVTAETVGFFCVGEMIGRLKIVGYHGGHGEHH